MDVYERAARVSRVYGSICLDVVLVIGNTKPAASLGANHANGNRLGESKGVTNGNYPLTHLDVVRVSKGEHRQILGVYLYYRHV